MSRLPDFDEPDPADSERREARRAARREQTHCDDPDCPSRLVTQPLPAAAVPEAEDGRANDCRHDSASGVDTTPDGPDKVWRCDHCGLTWRQGDHDNPSAVPARDDERERLAAEAVRAALTELSLAALTHQGERPSWPFVGEWLNAEAGKRYGAYLTAAALPEGQEGT